MPYIKQEERKEWEEIINLVVNKLKSIKPEKLEGNLNYFITKILKSVYEPSYFNYNRAMGLLECIKQEFYRKEVSPYEDKKEIENGKV